ncbi:tRNA (guanine-N(7)-)-methyltransferase non-catalytic subunit wdr4 [Esox lucius]|uniref:WD repeat-containing protein 4 n=1 Tax=Esox lucius TaxID=8010 RepID=A0A3P8YJX2_ESOLU|nr:tRNA (guanine-N(7)-)-methyltransferase non-catalytic subunit wdr4 [Esox lucius]
MAALDVCGEWLISTCDKKLIAVHTKQSREPFVFDCSTAEAKPKCTESDKSDVGGSEETSSDRILAVAVSTSGKRVALTDDTKRLVLFQCEPSWQVISTRWVVRRGTSLVFTKDENEVWMADKSGDVYSFSVVEPQKTGDLKLGHLSMLLSMTLTPDSKYVITADRDEKIRVSHLKSPYNIQAFCLGHLEFVSSLLVPPGHPHWLLSGSGDGTVKLWEYESGRRVQTWDLKQLRDMPNSENEKKSAVSRIAGSPCGRHVAVQCERLPSVQLFAVDQEGEAHLVPSSRLTLSHCPLDLTFDPEGRLWVLLDSREMPFLMYTHTGGSWTPNSVSPELKRVTEALRPHWDALQISAGLESRFQHLYKVSFDNMASYRQKKQERLQQQNEHWDKKRGPGNVQQSNGASKKAKGDKPVAQASK